MEKRLTSNKTNSNKIISQIRGMFDAVYARHDEYMNDDINLIKTSLSTFNSYVKSVYNMHIFEMDIASMRKEHIDIDTASYQAEMSELDTKRNRIHDAAIANCGELNNLCKDFNLPPFAPETKDRQTVANFCAAVTTATFLDGIGEDADTIDKVVEAIEHNGSSYRAKSIERLTQDIMTQQGDDPSYE